MIITLGQARSQLSQFAGKAGKCPDSEAVRLLVMEVVQLLLHRGAHGTLRKWEFCLCNGCLTAPPDLEVPIKVKIDGLPEKVWSYWYEFFDVHNADLNDKSFQGGLIEEVNTYYTIYDLPTCGARIAAVPLADEPTESTITIQGEDEHGRDVFTTIEGQSIHGERIKINRQNPVFTKTTFKKITSIEKTLTKNPVRLYWQIYDKENQKNVARGLLGEYRSTDTHPRFRRFRVPQARTDCCVKVTVLGRVRMLDSYHDNDILPVTSITALRKMAQSIQADGNDKLDVANAHSVMAEKILEDENQYYRTGQEPFDFAWEGSPGSNEPLI